MHHNNIVIRVRLRDLNISPGIPGLKIKWTRTMGQSQGFDTDQSQTSLRLVSERTSLKTDQSRNRPLFDHSYRSRQVLERTSLRTDQSQNVPVLNQSQNRVRTQTIRLGHVFKKSVTKSRTWTQKKNEQITDTFKITNSDSKFSIFVDFLYDWNQILLTELLDPPVVLSSGGIYLFSFWLPIISLFSVFNLIFILSPVTRIDDPLYGRYFDIRDDFLVVKTLVFRLCTS